MGLFYLTTYNMAIIIFKSKQSPSKPKKEPVVVKSVDSPVVPGKLASLTKKQLEDVKAELLK